MENEEVSSEATTLRDTLEGAYDAIEQDAVPGSQIGGQPAPSRVGATEDRVRDDAGRFAKADTVTQPPTVDAPIIAPIEAAAPPLPDNLPQIIPRPTSWKKDYDQQWNGLDPQLKQYITQREREYQSGVSTYKSEAENARHINEAIAPFLPNLQRYGLEPTQWIRNLGNAHERLALGSPQEKVQMGVQLIQQYGIDPQALFQVLSGQRPQMQQQQPQEPPPNIDKMIDDRLQKKEIQQIYERFRSEVPQKYPYFDHVKDTMAGILQAELAHDYQSAYEAAIRMPQHAEIWNALQQHQSEQADIQARAKSQSTVGNARARAVSVKSSTPSGQSAPVNGKKSLRDELSESFDTFTSSRV